jgi:Zn-dependent protease with chaperone function
MASFFKTTLLLGLMTALLMVIGGLLGGRGGLAIAFMFAIVMNFVSYWFSDKIVLRMYNAQPVDETQAAQLYQMVRNVVTRAGLPMPKVYLIPSDSPNAPAKRPQPFSRFLRIPSRHRRSRGVGCALFGARMPDAETEGKMLMLSLFTLLVLVTVHAARRFGSG